MKSQARIEGPALSLLALNMAGIESRELQTGDELRCPHCRRWHPLVEKPVDGTATGAGMLYFECRGLTYFGGFVGAGSRHEHRKAAR